MTDPPGEEKQLEGKDVTIAALKPYKGPIYRTCLPPEAEQQLCRILSERL